MFPALDAILDEETAEVRARMRWFKRRELDAEIFRQRELEHAGAGERAALRKLELARDAASTAKRKAQRYRKELKRIGGYTGASSRRKRHMHKLRRDERTARRALDAARTALLEQRRQGDELRAAAREPRHLLIPGELGTACGVDDNNAAALTVAQAHRVTCDRCWRSEPMEKIRGENQRAVAAIARGTVHIELVRVEFVPGWPRVFCEQCAALQSGGTRKKLGPGAAWRCEFCAFRQTRKGRRAIL